MWVTQKYHFRVWVWMIDWRYMCVEYEMGTWRKGVGREMDAVKAVLAGPKSLGRIFLWLCQVYIWWSVGISEGPNLSPCSSPRVWYTQLEATCSMWPQPSSTYLTSIQRMCSGAQQTLAGSLAIPMSPMDHWPTVPPVFWWEGSWDPWLASLLRGWTRWSWVTTSQDYLV